MSGGKAPLAVRVRNYLKAGYGVEDIAVREKEPLEAVRFHVRRMREKGELAALFKRGAK